MSYTGSRNLDVNESIARSYIHKFGDKVLLTKNSWILKFWKPREK